MVKSAEQREVNRIPFNSTVRFSLDGKTWHEDRAQDVSSTGILLRTPMQIESGTNLLLSFHLPNLPYQDPIDAEAKVIRTVSRAGKQIGLGLQFQTLKSSHYGILEEFVSRVMGIDIGDNLKAEDFKNAQGGFSFSMARLAQEAADRKAERQARLIEVRARAERRALYANILKKALLGAVVLFVGYMLYQIFSVIMDFALNITEVPK
ncbi:MAG: PilZ domain-containing protein [Proteobacteria bacterium]|nr:PilZ domain-containing protein [Pseudomonadota bacterium]